MIEVWTDKCHDENDKIVELDYELALTLASEVHGVEGHSSRVQPWVRGLASAWLTVTRPNHRMTQP